MFALLGNGYAQEAAPPKGFHRLKQPARSLSASADGTILAASHALKGLTLLRIEDGKIAQEEYHSEWPTLHAEPLEGGSFLLADRFEGIRLIAPEGQESFGGYKELLKFPCEGIPTHLAVSKDRLLIAAGGSGLLLYEWKDRAAAPSLRGRFPFVDYTKEVAIDTRGMAYLADNYETGLQIVDQRDPMRPKLMAMRTGGFCDSVTIHGEILAAANRQRGLQIWNVADPLHPALMETVAVEPGAVAKSVTFNSAGYLVLCEGAGGARLLQPKLTAAGVEMGWKGRLTPVGVGALDATFLPSGMIVVGSDKGDLIFCSTNLQQSP
ncbi:hypothetical protein IT570_05730 [Candidatus Sumerlaeota bacterium]|nr:hypothetical protein [Candidatus Sumerlaeota bacterium]